MTGNLPKQTVENMEAIIKNAIDFNKIKQTALVAMLMPGHGIPLAYTCGAVLNHDMIRIESFTMGWGQVAGTVYSEDYPESPRAVSISLGEIVWISPEIKEVR